MSLATVNAQFDAVFNRATFDIGREPGDPDDFQPADPATVCQIRLEIERKKRREHEEIKRRNRDATTEPFVHTPTPYPEL